MFGVFRRSAGCTRGLSLLEVSIAIGVLSTSILGIFSLYITTETMKIVSREDAVALYAAEEVINEIRSAPFSTTTGEKVVTDYSNETRTINLVGLQGANHRLGEVAATVLSGSPDGLKVEEELGIVIITEEKPTESNFGDVDGDGDMDFPVDLNLNGAFTDYLSTVSAEQTFPLDLGGDSGLQDTALTLSELRLVPVAVVVRWQSVAGMERRIQVLTLITDRSGGL